jgi:hypothetical protein
MLNMLRLLLAILLTLFTVAGPARALCAFDGAADEPAACCCVHDTDCAELSGNCCGTPVQPPAVPSQQQQQQFSAVALVNAILAAIPAAEATVTLALPNTQRKPLHLASNKIYLLKRSLLI